MKDHVTVKGHDGTFTAYIARPEELPAPAVVVLQELFGVNADIREKCDELAEQGFIAIAPELFWRQEPGVDLGVRSEADWQHGLRLYQAYNRDLDAAVAYHGSDTEKYLGEVDGLHGSLLMHLGEEDEFISKRAQPAIKAALAAKPNTTVYSYPGQCHAFSRHNGAHYNANAAALANGRTSEFLNQRLR
jgi:carboxymethylenebutenolidase